MAQKEFSIIWSFAAKYGNNFFGAFSKISSKMSDAAKNTKKYSEAVDGLSSAGTKNASIMARMTSAVSKYLEKAPRLNKMISALGGKKALGLGFGGLAALGGERLYNMSMNAASGMFEASRSAMSFESAMADVRKVVDFESADQFKEMSKAILDLSTRIPMAKEGLAQIVAAGGQSGIARVDLLAFAEAAAKMGVAFDITADQAGEMMAKWRTAFKMDQAQVETLADQINYLGNTTAASAPLISDVVTRIGPLGEIGGVAAGEIAALGATMISSGVESEVAATSIKNLILAMTAGESATSKQREAFQELGIDVEELAKRMQVDSKGAIADFFTALQGQDAAERGATLREIIGKESIAGVSGFLTNLDKLRENFGKVADAQQYAGSMQAEYDERSKTTENSIQLMNNQFEAMKVTLVDSLLPIIQDAAEFMGGLAQKMRDFANEHPQLMSFLTLATALIVGVGVVLGGLATIIAPIIIAVTSLSTAFGVAATTVLAVGAGAVAVVAGIAALVAAGWYLYNNWDQVKAYMAKLWDSPAAALIAFITGPIGWIIYAAAGVISHWDEVKAWFTLLWNDPGAALKVFVDMVKNKFADMYQYIAEKWEKLKYILSNPLTAAVNFVEHGNVYGSMTHQSTGMSADEIRGLDTGGIYSRGAFLTTFAEDSGESAIPHTPTARNIGLLARTNEIMGSPLGGDSYSIPISITVNGSADAGAASGIAAEVEAAVRRALANIENQKARVSYA